MMSETVNCDSEKINPVPACTLILTACLTRTCPANAIRLILARIEIELGTLKLGKY